MNKLPAFVSERLSAARVMQIGFNKADWDMEPNSLTYRHKTETLFEGQPLTVSAKVAVSIMRAAPTTEAG